MLNDREASTSIAGEKDQFRDIHALTPPPASLHGGRRIWETSSRRSSNLSMASEVTNPSENFSTMSHEFRALVAVGSHSGDGSDVLEDIDNSNLEMIGEEEEEEETNPLAIVPDNNPLDPPPVMRNSGGDRAEALSVQRVKRGEVEAKISAWENAKIAKINNRFKREDAVITGWENEQVQLATARIKKVERKLEEKRAKAMEKMQNEIAKAQRKAEERRASSEGRRGTKVANIFEVANLMRAIGKPPSKRPFF